ncbi:hypothetical protein ACFFWE_32865 [Sphaerisporangium melleum]|nr:hypothetical protein [Sphaerisporangium melleum]
MDEVSLHLSERLRRRVSEAARRQHVSDEEYMRNAIERSLQDDASRLAVQPRPRLPLFRSGDPTLAERLDDILAAGFGLDTTGERPRPGAPAGTGQAARAHLHGSGSRSTRPR